MSRFTGFLPLRRGLFEHVRNGRLGHRQAFCLIYILSQADTRTGIWRGCAKALSGELGMPERTARDILERLDQGGYIHRFTSPGSHTCYPILLHKYLITTGEHDGERLNALDSRTPVDLRYFRRRHNGEHGVEHGAAQKRIENRELIEEKNPAAQTAPPDQRRQPFIDFAYKTFVERFGQNPSWQGKDWKQLKTLLAATDARLEEIQARWRHYLASTEPFTAKKGGSLAYFCANFDAFINGPLLAPEKGTGHGKLTGEDLTRANLRAAGFPVN